MFDIGDITDTKFYLSIEKQHQKFKCNCIEFGKTYHGTKYGLTICIGFIMAHIR